MSRDFCQLYSICLFSVFCALVIRELFWKKFTLAHKTRVEIFELYSLNLLRHHTGSVKSLLVIAFSISATFRFFLLIWKFRHVSHLFRHGQSSLLPIYDVNRCGAEWLRRQTIIFWAVYVDLRVLRWRLHFTTISSLRYCGCFSSGPVLSLRRQGDVGRLLLNSAHLPLFKYFWSLDRIVRFPYSFQFYSLFPFTFIAIVTSVRVKSHFHLVLRKSPW